MLLLQRARSEEYQKEVTEGEGFNSCDTYAMAAAIDDTFILESDEVSVSCFENPGISFSIPLWQPIVLFRQVGVTVELEGKYTRGMMVLDYMELLDKKNKAFVMKKADLEKFKQMLMNSLL